VRGDRRARQREDTAIKVTAIVDFRIRFSNRRFLHDAPQQQVTRRLSTGLDNPFPNPLFPFGPPMVEPVPTAVARGADGAIYVTNNGVTAGAGQVLRIEP